MRIHNLYLENYRGIRNIELDFRGKSTVFYGINGSGKTSILNCISLLLSYVVNRAVSNQFKQSIAITRNDVRFGSSVTQLGCQFDISDEIMMGYAFQYRKETSSRLIRKKELERLSAAFYAAYLEDDDSNIPVFSYYGVNRAVLDIPLRIRTKHEFGRLATYQNCLNSKTDFRTFFEWFRNQEDFENQIKIEKKDFTYTDRSLEATRRAITSMLPELSNIRISRKPLRMCATKYGKTLSMEQLSDGEKCALAMFGDLARRLSIANPSLSNPLDGEGIVLIDEIELHMHPSWQRNIIPILKKTFPNIQFIVTTHSPLVLGELDDSFNVFQLNQTENDLLVTMMNPAKYDANLVLEDWMGTKSVSSEVSELEKEIMQKVYSHDFESAKEGIARLSKLTNGASPVITKAEILIKRLSSQVGAK